MDAPAYRIWPPVALGVPLFLGWVLSSAWGDPVELGGWQAPVGWVLVAAFVLWNGWSLWLFGRHETGLLPGQTTTAMMDSGPFGLSRNPLYVGLVALDLGLALVTASFWALVLVPVGVVALVWGAILPEERYLAEKFGADYEAYRARVRRWL